MHVVTNSRFTNTQLKEELNRRSMHYAYELATSEMWRARRREEVLEEVIRRLQKAREAGMSLSDMQSMARAAGVEL